MQITDVQVTQYRRSADGGSDYSAEIQIVEVTTDAGITGVGFASAPLKCGDIVKHMVGTLIAPVLLGKNPFQTTDIWQTLYWEAAPRRGGDGMMRVAIAAIDFALWDIKGKAAGVPVAQLLGSYREDVPTYANCAHHLPPEELGQRAAEYVTAGHRSLKIRGSRTFVSLAEATDRVRHVRSAIGSDVRLMVDVNGTWDVDTAVQQLKAWEPYDVYWLEEPVPPHDIAGYGRVRQRAGRTYIVGGEQHVGIGEFEALIERGGVDIIQPNAMVAGGITEWMRVHALATARGVPISPWNLQLVHLHMAAGLPNVQWIEYFMADNALLAFQGELFSTSMQEVVRDDGVYLKAPTAPGLGLELNPEVADRCRVA
ncbi:MAG: mandelate racemase/muconate lactonizing enzyme family protein [Hyphomicrobiaceae bacterium]